MMTMMTMMTMIDHQGPVQDPDGDRPTTFLGSW